MDAKEKVQFMDRNCNGQTDEMSETASLKTEITTTSENVNEIESKQPIFPPLTDEETLFEPNAASTNDDSEVNKSAFSSISTDDDKQDNQTDNDSHKYDTATQPFSCAVDDTMPDNTNKIEQEVICHYIEPKNPFASGLPEWTLEPPNLLVVRKQKK